VTPYLVDTGPIVAYLNRRDNYHDWAVSNLGQVEPPLLTCESVLSEAFFLLRKHSAATNGLIELIDRSIILSPFIIDEEFTRIGKLLKRYADVGISLADACLVRMTELYANGRLITLDTDFRVYRRNGRQVIPTITPGD
jgi:uncharacterized protein